MKRSACLLLLAILILPVLAVHLTPQPVHASADNEWFSNDVGKYLTGVAPDADGVVTIPTSIDGVVITELHHGTMSQDASVTAYRLDGESDYLTVEDGVLFNGDMTELIGYPPASPRSEYRIPDTVTFIRDVAFQYAENLRRVTFPEGLTRIDSNAFSCSGLEQLDLPASLNVLGTGAFSELDNLRQLAVPGTLTTLPSSAFAGCERLTHVTLQEGVKTIGKHAFLGCDRLESVTFPEHSLLKIGDFAFKFGRMTDYSDGNFSKLTYIAIPSSVKTIGDRAFGVFYVEDTSLTAGYRLDSRRHFTVYGEENSAASKYASENGLAFAPLSERPNGPDMGYIPYEDDEDFTAWIPYRERLRQQASTSGTSDGTPDGAAASGGNSGKSAASTASTTAKRPKATAIKSLSAGKKSFTVKWKKTSSITGVQIMYATNRQFTKGKKTVKVKGAGKTSRKVTKLKAKKTYYVKVRTYRTASGKTLYSAWSKAKKVKTKK